MHTFRHHITTSSLFRRLNLLDIDSYYHNRLLLMADGQLVSIWSQLHYAIRTLSPVRLVLKVTLFLLLHSTGVFLCFWGVFNRLGRLWRRGIYEHTDIDQTLTLPYRGDRSLHRGR